MVLLSGCCVCSSDGTTLVYRRMDNPNDFFRFGPALPPNWPQRIPPRAYGSPSHTREAHSVRERSTSRMYQSARTLRVFGEVLFFEREQRARAAWYAQAENRVMDGLRASLLSGARALRELGGKVELSEASAPLLESAPRWGRSLSVRYKTSEVLVYSARTPDSLSVHWAWVIHARRTRSARILSIPGFSVRRGVNQELIMQKLGPQAGRAPVELDQVAWLLLEMLGCAARARSGRP